MQVTISGMEGTIPASWFSHLEIAIERFESLSVRSFKEACISRKTPKYRLFSCL
jgi:hypothetical protein